MADVTRTGEPEPLPQAVAPPGARRVHLVVVNTRPADEPLPDGTPMLIAKYWQPRESRWAEQAFESIEHAVRLFVEEYGWVLRQQQVLHTPAHHELIFETQIERLSQPSMADVLEAEVGLTPKDVEDMLTRVDERVESDGGAG